MGAKEIVESYWDAHFSRHWDEMATFFSEDAHYTDVGLDAVGATGPDEIILRLRLGIEPLSGYVHFPKNMIFEGSFVVTEHLEQWQFHTGEIIGLSKHEHRRVYYRLLWHQLEDHFHSEDRTMRAHSIIITRISQDPRTQNPRLEENAV